MKRIVNKLTGQEKGQTLILVLILLLLGGLIIAPLLAYISTGLEVGRKVYEKRTELFYAADSGVEDALWQIKYDQLDDLFTTPAYNPYDYEEVYPYSLPSKVNDKDVDVTIENIWIPKDIPAPDANTAKQIIEGTEAEPVKLIITGSIPGASEYQIKIIYYWDDGEDETLEVEKIGIWLPRGFDYAGNCSLEGESYYPGADVDDYCSGKAVVWNFSSLPQLKAFPGDTGYPMVRTITFDFSAPPGQTPGVALSWVDTTGVTGIDYTWDADTKVYKITSTATDATTGKQTIVDAYTAKSEMRELGSAMSGDYCAVGATLLTATRDEKYRDRLFKESSATVTDDDIPPSAHVDAAYLYWSGWLEKTGVVWEDECDNMDSWIPGSDWSLYVGWGDKEFVGHHSGVGEGRRYLTMLDSWDLSSYDGGTVAVSWEQDEAGWLESDDCLLFQFSGDGGSTWGDPIPAFCGNNPPSSFSYIVPAEYLTINFKMRFYLSGFSGSDWWGREHCYIDDIKISAEQLLVESSKFDRVLFNNTQITADEWQVQENVDQPDTWSYACYYDATDLVEQFIEDEEIGSNGSGTYTVGHVLEDGPEVYELYPSGTTGYPLGTPAVRVGWSYPNVYEWAYAGWSLVIIYSSPETKGHQLYLYDDFVYSGMNHNVDFDNDGEPGGTISGFLVPDEIIDENYAAKLTCFIGEGDEVYPGDKVVVNNDNPLSDGRSSTNVWNSWSLGLTEDGIDIDTFTIEYPTIEPGDTSAQVDLPTETDSWNLVYIILSFRSKITTGGTLTYLIRG